jgi:tRNA(Ile)-lysidine synthase TilS/MesJ
LVEKINKICSICKKRPAIYYRAYSGEYICAKCLNNVIEKGVKRVINKIKILSMDSKIVIPITYFSPSSSVVLSNILYRIEKQFKSKIAIIIPNNYNIEEIKIFLDNKVDIFIAKISIKPPDRLSLIECLRYERAWSIKAAKALGYNFIALPITRTDISLILLDSLLNGRIEFISESLEFLDNNGIKIFYPFSGIEGEMLASYEFISGIKINPLCLTYIKSKNIFYSIAGSRPELDFGSQRIIERFNYAANKLAKTKCKICGGFSDNEICNTCNKLNLKNIDVTLSVVS